MSQRSNLKQTRNETKTKHVRKQLKHVINEKLSEVVNEAILDSIKKDVMAYVADQLKIITCNVDARLSLISAQLDKSLNELDKRQKDISISMLQAVKPMIPDVKNS